MLDLSKISEEATRAIFSVVEKLQPCTAEQVHEQLCKEYGLTAGLGELVHYMEWLRSAFPKKLAHAGPERWVVVEL